jgi:Tfp pilus assembly protein PilP
MMAASVKKTIFGLLLWALFLAACGDDGSSSSKYRDFGSNKRGPGSAAAEARKRAAQAKNAQGDAKDRNKGNEKIALPELTEVSFIADPKRRDPFSPFWELLLKKDKPMMEVERNVKLKEYDITELKLIGIITNIGDDRAMVTTPDKTGYVLKRGDYVGRTDFVKQGNDGSVIQVNWRVARIHGSGKEEERGIYLVRDDPTTARGVDITRFIPLHPPE